MRASIIALAALAVTPAFAGAAIAAMLAATAAIAGADPDKERFKECMEAQAAATNWPRRRMARRNSARTNARNSLQKSSTRAGGAA
jgi:hypothetical protein